MAKVQGALLPDRDGQAAGPVPFKEVAGVDAIPARPVTEHDAAISGICRGASGFWLLEDWARGTAAMADERRGGFVARPGDVVLATLPKAGTTWLKALAFATMARGLFPPASPDHPLRRLNSHDCVPTVESGLFACGREAVLDRLPSPRLLNTHLPLSLLPSSITDNDNCKIVYVCRYLLFPTPSSFGFVYTTQIIIGARSKDRNQLVITYAQGAYRRRRPGGGSGGGEGWEEKAHHHLAAPQGDENHPTIDEEDRAVSRWHFIKHIKRIGSDVPFSEVYKSICEGTCACGPVWDHILGYWNVSKKEPSRVLFLTYEQMLQDPMGTIRQLARFLGQPISDAEEETGVVAEIVELCSLESNFCVLPMVQSNGDPNEEAIIVVLLFGSKVVVAYILDWKEYYISCDKSLILFFLIRAARVEGRGRGRRQRHGRRGGAASLPLISLRSTLPPQPAAMTTPMMTPLGSTEGRGGSIERS
uniref:Sulfotransferase n=1 Tax=Oryza glumipatula TaxID=40148 RepID=A0A0E0AT64_9ORYZ